MTAQHPPFLMRRVQPQPPPNVTQGNGKAGQEEKKNKSDEEGESEDENDDEENDDDDDEGGEEDETNVILYEYYGFLMDLFEEIKQEIKKTGKTFPKYEIKEIEPGPASFGLFYGGDRLEKGKSEFTGIVKEMFESVSRLICLIV
jgi:hypothetical protein